MSKIRGIKDLLESIGRALRGPLPAPRPAPPRPVPAPQPAPRPYPRPAPRPAPPKPNPTPPPDPKPSPPRRPVPPRGETETETQPETQPQPETTPNSQSETEGATKVEDDPQCETCPECAARDMGVEIPVSIHGPNEKNVATKLRAAAYQHFVCPWHLYSPETNQIGEWLFSEVKFDGLHPVECHLYEAKHGYDGFLEQRDWSAQGGPQLRPWAEKAKVTVFDEMVRQGRRQHKVVVPHFGEVYLTWVFSHSITQLYVGRLFLGGISGWYHDMEVRPWTSG